MSFSEEVKEELSKLNNFSNKTNLKAELNGYLLSNNVNYANNLISFATENIDNCRRYQKILDNLKINYTDEKKGKLYITAFEKDNKLQLNDIDIESKEVLKCVLRGAFMSGGAVNNPNKKYHLEIFLSSKENAKYISYIMEQFAIFSKLLKRERSYSIYLKDGEAISNFLALIGANKSVLNFEEIRVVREIKNNVNRVVNCETANLNKIINVSVKQIEDINYIKKRKKFEELPSTLKEIATLRLENPDKSFIELGKMLSEPIGKSGVNHRLKKISDIADELKKEENR